MMARLPWICGLLVAAAVGLGAGAAVVAAVAGGRAADRDAPLERVAWLRATGGKIDPETLRSLEYVCILGGIWPAKHPELAVALGELRREGGGGRLDASPPGAMLLLACLSAGLAGAAALMAAFLDLRRLRRKDAKLAESLTGQRSGLFYGAAGMAAAGGLAVAVGAWVLRRGTHLSVQEGALHGVVGVLALPVSAWLLCLLSLRRRGQKRAERPAAVLLCGLLAAVLMAGWGFVAGAWNLKFYSAGLLVWPVLTWSLGSALRERAECVVRNWTLSEPG